MASPLHKRFPRELKDNLGKYLGIFLLMSVTIALTSGFLLAAHSIGVIIDDMPEKYSIEDARFTTAFESHRRAAERRRRRGQRRRSGRHGHRSATGPSTRISTTRKETTAATARCASTSTAPRLTWPHTPSGRVPEAAGEVAIDRVFATNNGITVGEEVELFGQRFTVCGIMTTSDNQALFQRQLRFHGEHADVRRGRGFRKRFCGA